LLVKRRFWKLYEWRETGEKREREIEGVCVVPHIYEHPLIVDPHDYL
jgi:hypothetical protein